MHHLLIDDQGEISQLVHIPENVLYAFGQLCIVASFDLFFTWTTFITQNSDKGKKMTIRKRENMVSR